MSDAPTRSPLRPERFARALAIVVCVVAAGGALSLGKAWERLHRPEGFLTLPSTFAVWDTAPATEHLFLTFTTPDDFPAKRAYQSTSSAWMVLLYALFTPIRLLGFSYDTAQSGVMFITFAAILALVWRSLDAALLDRRLGPDADRAIAGGALMLALAGLGTVPAFWVAAFIGNPEDQNRFLTALVFVYISVLDYRRQPLDRTGWIGAIAVALLAPMYVPFLLLTMAVIGLSEQRAGEPTTTPSGLQWPRWRQQATILLALCAIGLAVPRLGLVVGGFRGVGGGILYRSGLDGSTEYFSNVFQAILSPIVSPAIPEGRHWSLIAPVVALSGVVAMALHSRALAARLLRQLVVASAGSLLWVAVFPQVVSIHPYLYDFGLLFPGAFCLAFWLADRDVAAVLMRRRGLLLGIYIVLIALLMTNAIEIARLRVIKPLF